MPVSCQILGESSEPDPMTLELSPRNAGNDRWHTYRLEERHAPWKVLLPIAAKGPVLAVGLEGNGLAGLARSWKTVFVHRCRENELQWAAEQGKRLGQHYRFEILGQVEAKTPGYSAIVTSANCSGSIDPGVAFRLLEPGGSALWVGSFRSLPSVADLEQNGYHQIRRYAILPPGTGKIIVPLEDGRLTQAGLNLYRPLKWYNQAAVKIGKIIASLPCRNLLGYKQVLVARKPGQLGTNAYLLDWLGQRMGCCLGDVSIFTGWTKLVLQLFDSDGRVVGLAKLSDIPLGQHGIEQENMALQRLKTVAEFWGNIPRILTVGEWGGHTVQVQTAVDLSDKKYSTKLTHAHQEFLLSLSRLDQSEGSLDTWPHWAGIWRWAHEVRGAAPKEAEAIRVAVERCADNLGKRKIGFHRVHGDFTPWQVLLGPKGLTVLDWEESEEMGLPLMDAVHFVMTRDAVLYHRAPSIDQILNGSPFALDTSDELTSLRNLLHIPADIVRLVIIFELYKTQTNFYRAKMTWKQ
jgi:hypothetical protein